MYPRLIQEKITTAVEDTPAIMLVGPRQCGKTTLVKQIMGDEWDFVTLDDINQLEFAQSDPIGFIRNFSDSRVIIDEVQRVPELFLPIKQSIDENRMPGKFILTGSANAMALPTVADSLAGRLEVITLLPLAECEINKTYPTFLTNLFSQNPLKTRNVRIREALIDKVLQGGFPNALMRKDPIRRSTWFNQYMLSLIQKDLKDLDQIEHLDIMPKLIRLLCNQVGNLVNYTAVGNSLGLSRQTIARYLQLLSQLFIFQELPAWHRNENKRLIKTPKIHLVDSGLLCAFRKVNKEKIINTPKLFGSLLESYIVCELRRLASWHDEPLQFFHYRDKDQVEVDIVIETLSGDVVGIEVKASATLNKKDFQGLKRLKCTAGKKFLMGVVLYDGDHTNVHDDNIFSAPLATIWE